MAERNWVYLTTSSSQMESETASSSESQDNTHSEAQENFSHTGNTETIAMFTFLEEYDFSDKTIILFCTHGGSALGSSESNIASLSRMRSFWRGLR